MARHGCFPGSFDPLTVAHMAVAEAARRQCALSVVDLVMSEAPLAKDHATQTPIEDRRAAMAATTAPLGWVQVRISSDRLVVDLARGYDVVILGADKWHQLHDPRFYGGSAEAMAAALAALPTVAVAPRTGARLPPDEMAGVVVLDVHEDHHGVSATAVRNGRDEWRFGG